MDVSIGRGNAFLLDGYWVQSACNVASAVLLKGGLCRVHNSPQGNMVTPKEHLPGRSSAEKWSNQVEMKAQICIQLLNILIMSQEHRLAVGHACESSESRCMHVECSGSRALSARLSQWIRHSPCCILAHLSFPNAYCNHIVRVEACMSISACIGSG